jgi:hypothetical protein
MFIVTVVGTSNSKCYKLSEDRQCCTYVKARFCLFSPVIYLSMHGVQDVYCDEGVLRA